MKRLFPLGLLLTFLFIYMEWGNNQQFVFQMQYDAIANIANNASSLSNPLVFVLFFAEILLIIALLQRQPNRIFILAGTVLLLPYVILAFLGGLAGHPKVWLSTFPFLAMAIFFFVKFRRFNQA
ncbi:hypothetical protein FLLO111716_13155 [Flavobacterium longum]|uniref:hypothetical protein n=1 Tax=Flavobacterium longum TaxID=1299340 RepID=UPI0039ED8DE1